MSKIIELCDVYVKDGVVVKSLLGEINVAISKEKIMELVKRELYIVTETNGIVISFNTKVI